MKRNVIEITKNDARFINVLHNLRHIYPKNEKKPTNPKINNFIHVKIYLNFSNCMQPFPKMALLTCLTKKTLASKLKMPLMNKYTLLHAFI